MRIAVVGAGVIGITTAVAMKEAFPSAELTVFSEAFSPETTGDGSAGLWTPYIIANTDEQKILRWSQATHKWLEIFWKSEMASDVGVSLLPSYRLTSSSEGLPVPVWGDVVYGCSKLNKKQLERLSKTNEKNYTAGYHYITYTCEPTKMLPFLMKKLRSMNVRIVKTKIKDLKKLKEQGFDVVINCSGIGSRELCFDKSVIPIRGQVTRVKAPWMFETFLEEDDEGNYVIPNMESVVLGGTHQENDFSVSVCPNDLKFILNGCKRLYPSLDNAEVLKKWVGLRPGRDEVRLELEIVRTEAGQDLTIVHNYGHGGCGITLSWGCAMDVVEMLRQHLKTKNSSKL
ncbi:D-aspartate oxidase [Nasonia vitripennis]|uniref:FAD dependent oxidoreductase domain-containing protein n=1 Tax=Nasonia vitripennis TaxID=7425 RepID=A0A7M7H1Z1_NASVI|nr:D-aspartate oxidase [Nasonia vitripennis]